MLDRVVLDETLAWQLFGGFDVAGLTVTISGKPFQVAGVVRRESDFATKEAYQDGASMFLSYSAMKSLDENSTITCYEIVMPDPITGLCQGHCERELRCGHRRYRGKQQPLFPRKSLLCHRGFWEALHAQQRRHLSLLGECCPPHGGLFGATAGADAALRPHPGCDTAGAGDPAGHPHLAHLEKAGGPPGWIAPGSATGKKSMRRTGSSPWQKLPSIM